MKNLLPWKIRKKEPLPARASSWFDTVWNNALTDWNDFDRSIWDTQWEQKMAVPAVNISEDEKDVYVEIETPGMCEKDLSLTYKDGVLSIEGEKKEERKDKKRNSHYTETRYGSFQRSIYLGRNLDWEHAKAKCKNGIAYVEIPKKVTNHKKIEISID